MTIGVLALQGAFIEHIQMLEKLGVKTQEIRKTEDFSAQLDGLILPGGESTTIGKLLHDTSLFLPIKECIDAGMPVFGTCAGMILVAKEIADDSTSHFQAMDIQVKRNAYGRQLGSFGCNATFADEHVIEMPFIRAPYISSHGKAVKILSVVDGNIVAAQENNMLVTAFHPELTDDTTVHEHFISIINKNS